MSGKFKEAVEAILWALLFAESLALVAELKKLL